MTKRPQVTTAPDWAVIIAQRPDLESPGYQETLKLMREEKAKKS